MDIYLDISIYLYQYLSILDAEVLVLPPVFSASSCDRRRVGAGRGNGKTETESQKLYTSTRVG